MDQQYKYVMNLETEEVIRAAPSDRSVLFAQKHTEMFRFVSKQEYRDFCDRKEEKSRLGDFMSRVEVHVPRNEYEAFVQRVHAEGVEDPKTAVVELIRQYAHGAVLTHVTKHAKGRGVDYLQEAKA